MDNRHGKIKRGPRTQLVLSGLRSTIVTAPKLRAMQRVENYIAAHPGCNARDICAGLGICNSTLNVYTIALRTLERITASAPSKAGQTGSQQNIFHLVPDLPPMAADRPVLVPRPPLKAARIAAARAMPVQQWDVLAALFGTARH